VRGRFIGESIRLIADTMDFTKIKNIPGIAVFVDFEKALDSIESKNALNLSTLDQMSGKGSMCSIKTSPVASLTMVLPLNTST